MKRLATFLHRQWLRHRLRQAQADINQIARDRAHLDHALDYALRESTQARAALWYLDHPPMRTLARVTPLRPAVASVPTPPEAA